MVNVCWNLRCVVCLSNKMELEVKARLSIYLLFSVL